MSEARTALAQPVLAAGVLLWRESNDGPELLLVERTQHRDISLPKGKLDPGETLPECAVRELAEETGVSATLGAPLGHSEYRLPDGRDKVVYYWLARKPDGAASAAFKPNDEIHALHWLTLDKAKKACTYGHDVAIIESFEERLGAAQADTFVVVALRHAKAEFAAAGGGSDVTRELTARGRLQAKQIAGGVAAFGPRRVFTSHATRCRQTVAPLEQAAELMATVTDELWQESDSIPAIERQVAKAISKRRATVLCSHGPVIPEIVTAVVHATNALETDVTHRASILHTAEFTVMHVSSGDTPELVALETHGAPPAQ